MNDDGADQKTENDSQIGGIDSQDEPKCPECGTPIRQDDVVCRGCGVSLAGG